MKNLEEQLNSILVNIFNNILIIEEDCINCELNGDITITEMHTIEAVGMNDPKTMSQTASDLRITLGTLTTSVNNLVKKGYVERFRSEDDRRVVKIKLTEKGKIVYDAHNSFHINIVKEMVKDLERDEVILLIKSLNKIHHFFN